MKEASLKEREQYLLVDIRRKDETATGILPGAKCVIWKDENGQNPHFLEEIKALEKEAKEQGKPLALICHAGGRSSAACDFLETQGIEAFSMTGGMSRALIMGIKLQDPAV